MCEREITGGYTGRKESIYRKSDRREERQGPSSGREGRAEEQEAARS